MEVARSVASYLRAHFGATRVFVFGSLVAGDYDERYSDIDIYFEGVAAGEEGAAAGSAMMEFLDADLDMFPQHECGETFRKKVIATRSATIKLSDDQDGTAYAVSLER